MIPKKNIPSKGPPIRPNMLYASYRANSMYKVNDYRQVDFDVYNAIFKFFLTAGLLLTFKIAWRVPKYNTRALARVKYCVATIWIEQMSR